MCGRGGPHSVCQDLVQLVALLGPELCAIWSMARRFCFCCSARSAIIWSTSASIFAMSNGGFCSSARHLLAHLGDLWKRSRRALVYWSNSGCSFPAGVVELEIVRQRLERVAPSRLARAAARRPCAAAARSRLRKTKPARTKAFNSSDRPSRTWVIRSDIFVRSRRRTGRSARRWCHGRADGVRAARRLGRGVDRLLVLLADAAAHHEADRGHDHGGRRQRAALEAQALTEARQQRSQPALAGLAARPRSRPAPAPARPSAPAPPAGACPGCRPVRGRPVAAPGRPSQPRRSGPPRPQSGVPSSQAAKSMSDTAAGATGSLDGEASPQRPCRQGNAFRAH